MFNYCFFSGEVLTEPEIKRYDNISVTEFELGIAVGRTPAGKVNVTCFRRLALVTAKHLHQGDRVSLMGHLFWFPSKKGERHEREAPELLAMDMEFVKSDSHVLGLVFPDDDEEEDQ
jgi:single-strand DNA-binding protein